MSKHRITKNGEEYISHVLARKHLGFSRKELNDLARDGKVEAITQEIVPSQSPFLATDLLHLKTLERHFYKLSDLQKARQSKKKK
ncbi:MAG: hypothetical protein HY652_03800 [Acidobacteria bacterium]|nr:hypothetical protein [Acidobacteriota bacterium]